MKLVRQWSTVVCIAAIICTMLELLLPCGKMEKIFKFILSTFLLCAMISPISGTVLKISFDMKKKNFDKIENSSLKEKILGQEIDIASENIKVLAKKELDRLNVKPKKIEVVMDTDSLTSISMLKMKLYLSENHLHQDIKKVLKDNLGIETEIICGSE